MNKMGCTPNAYTYCSLMKGYFKTSDSNKAILLWKDMATSGITCNEICYSVLIHGLCQDGKLKEAMMVWKHMLGKGLVPDAVAYSSMIHGLCNAGSVDQGLRLFNEMLCRGSDSQPDVVAYNIIINALCKVDRISLAIDLLNTMLDRGCDPDKITCNIFLKTLNEKANPSQDGEDFLDKLVLQLYRRQRIIGASRIIEVMLQKILSPKSSTWEMIIRELCKPKKVQGAINKCWSDLFI